jgi:hypothetical protein
MATGIYCSSLTPADRSAPTPPPVRRHQSARTPAPSLTAPRSPPHCSSSPSRGPAPIPATMAAACKAALVVRAPRSVTLQKARAAQHLALPPPRSRPPRRPVLPARTVLLKDRIDDDHRLPIGPCSAAHGRHKGSALQENQAAPIQFICQIHPLYRARDR